MAPRVDIYASYQNPATDKPRYKLPRKWAIQLIADRRAAICGENAVQILDRATVKSSDAIYVPTQQGDVYELAAIDPNPRTFSGGLTRTEKRPFRFERFKAARVGHQ